MGIDRLGEKRSPGLLSGEARDEKWYVLTGNLHLAQEGQAALFSCASLNVQQP